MSQGDVSQGDGGQGDGGLSHVRQTPVPLTHLIKRRCIRIWGSGNVIIIIAISTRT